MARKERYRKEVEEILARAEMAPAPRRPENARAGWRRGNPMRAKVRVSAPGLLAAALLMLVAAIALRRFFAPLSALALALFVWAYWLNLRPGRRGARTRRGPREQHSRGDVIEYPEPLSGRARRWRRRIGRRTRRR